MKKQITKMAALCAVLCTLTAPVAHADTAKFPQAGKQVTLVVGFSPGGSNDIAARVIAPQLSRELGVPVVVENRVGAAGSVATAYLAKATPDGHTLMVTSASPLVVNPHTQARVPYNALTDFRPVSLIGVTPEVLALNPKVQATSISELVALTKKGQLTLASSGNGGLPHLAIELLNRTTGAQFLHVPYKGASAAVNDALAGHVDGVVVDLPAVFNYFPANQLRGVAVADGVRSKFVKNISTSGEQGFGGFVAVNWIGLIAPAKTPDVAVNRIHQAIKKIAALPAVTTAFENAAIDARTSDSPEAFGRFVAEEYVKWEAVVKESGAKAD